MKDGAAVIEERTNQARDSTSLPHITMHSDEEPASEDESGVLLSEPTAFLTGDLSAFQTSLFSVDTSDEVVRTAKRRSIRQGILAGILIGFPTMMLMFGFGFIEGDWSDEHNLEFTSEGEQKTLELQNEADLCEVGGNVYEMGDREWFSSSLRFRSDCDGTLRVEGLSILIDLTFSNGSATTTHNLSVIDERCDITLRVRETSESWRSIESSSDYRMEESPMPRCDGEHILNANVYFEQEDISHDVGIGIVNMEGGIMTLTVNQTNISSLGSGPKQALVSIVYIGWWDDGPSEPGPVIGFVEGSTLRFTSSAPLDFFTTPVANVDYRIQGGGMSGDEADATEAIMLGMTQCLCCFGLFILPLGVSMKKKDNHFAISQFLTMLPFILIGWIGTAASGGF